MDDLKNKFYKFLIDRENFYMKQYYSNFHKENYFVAIKELEEGIYCVLITDEKEEDIDLLECIEYLKTLGKKFSMNIVVLSEGEYIYLNSHGVNKIIINKNDYSLIGCDEPCIPLRKVLQQIQLNREFQVNKFFKENISTMILIGINIIVFLITALLSNNIFDIDTMVLLRFGAKYNPLIYSGEVWRLLTCAFLHGGIMHIGFNMYALYVIGPQIEQIYETKNYLLIYLSSCITASLLGVIASPRTISVGASGGIFGLMGALLAFAVCERHKLEKKYVWSLIQVILINLVIGLSLNNIDNFGHIGGLLGGAIIGYCTYKLQKRNSIRIRKNKKI